MTLHSNVEFNIQHGDTLAGDNGYAKVVHILPTAVWNFQPSGGAGDYRLNTSFVLETNAGLYFFNVGGGSGSGVAIAGTVTLNGLANFQIGNAPVTFSNVISGTGGFYLNQYGGYPLVFTAANTYQGITDIRSGLALALVGNGSIPDSAVISLASGATLAVTNRNDGTLTLDQRPNLAGRRHRPRHFGGRLRQHCLTGHEQCHGHTKRFRQCHAQWQHRDETQRREQ